MQHPESVYILKKKGACGEQNNNDGFGRKIGFQSLYFSGKSSHSGHHSERPQRSPGDSLLFCHIFCSTFSGLDISYGTKKLLTSLSKWQSPKDAAPAKQWPELAGEPERKKVNNKPLSDCPGYSTVVVHILVCVNVFTALCCFPLKSRLTLL